MVKVLMVCMGNICRSPTAEAVLRRFTEQMGLQRQILVDSAGTTDYHKNEAPDRRAQMAAQRRGYEMAHLRSRKVEHKDFVEFDYLLAMDNKNLSHLKAFYPVNGQAKVSLFLDYSRRYPGQEMPDPYFGGAPGFELVLDQSEDAARGLLEHIIREHLRPAQRA